MTKEKILDLLSPVIELEHAALVQHLRHAEVADVRHIRMKEHEHITEVELLLGALPSAWS